jgi:hypothetical protein
MGLIRKIVIGLVVLIVLIVVGVTVVRNVVFQDVGVIEQVEMSEAEINVIENTKVGKKSGSFEEIDFIHKGSGNALYMDSDSGPVLKLEDFKVTPGPDLFVYLSKERNIKESKELGEFVSLGKLESSSGDQMYTLPSDYEDYNSVVIWCRAFGVLFSVAELN